MMALMMSFPASAQEVKAAQNGFVENEDVTVRDMMECAQFVGKENEHEYSFKISQNVTDRMRALSCSDTEVSDTTIKVITLDEDATDAWDEAVSAADTRDSGSKYEQAYDSSGWVLMYTTFYYTYEGTGASKKVRATKATYGFDRGQPSIVVTSAQTVIMCQSVGHTNQIKTEYPSMQSNKLYTVNAPSSWVAILPTEPLAWVGSSAKFTFSRGTSSTWTSQVNNYLIQN